MNELSQGSLAKIEEFARLQFSVEQVLILVGGDSKESEEQLLAKQGSAYIAFRRGQLKAIAEVRHCVLQKAKQGSFRAQKQILDIIAANKKTMDFRKRQIRPSVCEDSTAQAAPRPSFGGASQYERIVR